MAGLCDGFSGFDGGADGCGVERSDGAEAGVEDELRSLRVGSFVGSLLRRCGECCVNVADEDALTEVGAGGFAELCGLCVGFRSRTVDVEASDAAI